MSIHPRSCLLPTRDVLTQVEHLLGTVDHEGRRRLTASERLALVDAAGRVGRRVESLRAVLVGEAETAKASMIARGTPTTSFLVGDQTSSAEAAALVFAGKDVTAHRRVRDAALTGEISLKQARAVTDVLGELPPTLSTEQRERAQDVLLDKASRLPAKELSRQVRAVLEEVAPELDAVEDELRRLETRATSARAHRNRWFVPDGRGAILVKGSLAEVDAAPLIALVDAFVESDRRGRGASDGSDSRTPEQRRADALVTLATEGARRSPQVAGDRPRLVVTMSYDAILDRLEQVGALADGTAISAGELRRVACDADVTPVVLGSRGEILDVGSTSRLVTPEIRRAMGLRDRGCTFPGCEVPDTRCEAHHTQPWWISRRTSLDNLASLCRHHHGLCEPPRFWSGSQPDRWEVRVAEDGVPEFLPPRSADPDRAPRRHARFGSRVGA